MAQFVQNQLLGGGFETARYSSIQPLQCGVFGLSCSAKDRKNHQIVTMQKYSEPFASASMTRHILREVKLLRQMKHENVVALIDLFISPSKDMYIVTELMDIDLQTLLRSKPIQGEFVQYLLYQIMRGLKYIHSAGVVHGDLQPRNILLNHNCDLKIKGYGKQPVHGHWMSSYPFSHHYTAPEVMLASQRYDEFIDVWSAGCIFAELLQGEALFPGQNDIHHFHIITEILGTPSETVTKRMASGNALNFIQSLPKHEAQPLSDILPGIGPKASELLENLLVFDPRGRVTASDALQFAYLAPYHDPTDEPEFEGKFDRTFDTANNSVDVWKARLHAEILDFHREEVLRDTVQRWLKG